MFRAVLLAALATANAEIPWRKVALCAFLKDDAEVMFPEERCCNGTLVTGDADCGGGALSTYNSTKVKVIPDCYESKALAAVVAPKSASGLSRVVLVLRLMRQAFTVMSGGHGGSCASVCDGCITLSNELLSSVELINKGGQDYITVSGTSTLRDLVEVWADSPYMLPHADYPTIGVIGHALGGGVGMATRAYGFLCDHIVGAEIVLNTGVLVQAFEAEHEDALYTGRGSTRRHRDLLWALKGAGHIGLGVVTKLWFKPVVRPEKIVYGFIRYPLLSVEDVQRHFTSACHYFGAASEDTVDSRLHVWASIMPVRDLNLGQPLTESLEITYIPRLGANESEVYEEAMEAIEEMTEPYRAAGVEPVANTVKIAPFLERWAPSGNIGVEGSCGSRAVVDKSAMCNDEWISDASERIFNLSQPSVWLAAGEFPYWAQEKWGGAALWNDPSNERTAVTGRGSWQTYNYCRWRTSDATPMTAIREEIAEFDDLMSRLSNTWYNNYADFHVTSIEQLYPDPVIRSKLSAIKRKYDPHYNFDLDGSEPRLY